MIVIHGDFSQLEAVKLRKPCLSHSVYFLFWLFQKASDDLRAQLSITYQPFHISVKDLIERR